MTRPFPSISLLMPIAKALFVFMLASLTCPHLWAAQDGVVTVDRAYIYADMEMTSPVGFVARGKRVRVGEIPRNKAQVYPIVVSGKVAYIKISDISTQREVVDSNNLVAERFIKQTRDETIRPTLAVSAFNYSSTASVDQTNGTIEDKDAVSWTGYSIKGTGYMNKRWDVHILGSYYDTVQGQEEFKVYEAGIGLGYRLINWSRLAVRLEAQALAIPFASYSFGSSFRVVGRGFSAGAGVNISYELTDHWGLDVFGGSYYTRLFSLDAPKPFVTPKPIFYGNRLGAGLHYTF